MAKRRTDENENRVLKEYLETANAEAVKDLRTMAESYFTYYATLREAGFDTAQAMQLVAAMQAQFLAKAQGGGER